MTLCRVVCEAQHAQLKKVCRAGPTALTIKWFATSIADAPAWGRGFIEKTGVDHPYVIAIEFDLDASPPERALPEVDGIAPTLCALHWRR